MRKLWLCAAAALLSVTLTGCEQKKDEQKDAASGPSMEALNSGKPANLPDYAEIYPGAKIVTKIDRLSNTGEFNNASMVLFDTPDSTDAVADFYRSSAAKHGLTIVNDQKILDSYNITAHKGAKPDIHGYTLSINYDFGVDPNAPKQVRVQMIYN